MRLMQPSSVLLLAAITSCVVRITSPFDIGKARFAARFAFSSYEEPDPALKRERVGASVYVVRPRSEDDSLHHRRRQLPPLQCTGDADDGRSYRWVAFIDAPSSGTQLELWRRDDPGGGGDGEAGHAQPSLVVSFRGTTLSSLRDVLTDISARQKIVDCTILCPGEPTSPAAPAPMAHSGFLNAYTSVRPVLLQLLKEHGLDLDGDAGTLLVTGHSLGGALAMLTAVDLAQLGPRLATYTFGQPRVGNRVLAKAAAIRCATSEGPYRVVVANDVVPRLPRGASVNRLFDYTHCGETVQLTKGSPLVVDGDGERCPLREIDPGFRGFFPLDFRKWDPLPVRAEFIASELALLFRVLFRGGLLSSHFRESYDVALCDCEIAS